MGARRQLYAPYEAGYRFRWDKSRIYDGRPAMILVGWYTGYGAANRNGGHYVVAARVARNGHVVVLDPLLGTLHELRGHNGVYNNHGLRGRMDYVYYTGG